MNYEKEIPVYGTAQTVDIVNMGYNYDWLQNIFLSSYSVEFTPLTSINRHTNIRRISAICPAFDGFLLPLSTYNVVDRNTLRINLSSLSLSGDGYIDVIFENIAGYTKLTNINHILLYTPKDISTINFDTISGYGDVTFTPLSAEDTDNDGYTDIDEMLAGTDINNPLNFPISLFNVYNNI